MTPNYLIHHKDMNINQLVFITSDVDNIHIDS